MKTTVAKNGNGKNRVDELLNGKRMPIPPLKEKCTIPAPNMQVMRLTIRGTGPYVQLRFSEKQLNIMRANQEAGSTSAKGKKRAPKDFSRFLRRRCTRRPQVDGVAFPLRPSVRRWYQLAGWSDSR